MDESRLELCLRDALLLAAAERYRAVREDTAEPRGKWRRRFDRMLTDPFGYAERQRRSISRQIRRYGLVAALILAILAGAIFAVPQTRAVAVNLLEHWFSDHVTYSFGYETKNTLPKVEIQYIPQGYKQSFVFAEDLSEETINLWNLKNTEEQQLMITVALASENFSYSVDNEHREKQMIELLTGEEAIYYKPIDNDWSSDLIWNSPDGRYFFAVKGSLPLEELLRIADGICLRK